MSIENILERIGEEAESAARRIMDEAQADADRIGMEYSEKAAAIKEELGARAEKKAREEERRLIVNEQLELRKKLLAKKREILDELYDGARKRIEALTGDEYLDLLKTLILQNAVSGREEIIVSPEHENFFTSGFISSLNREYPGGGNFTLSEEPGDFAWGVVLKEGRRVVDLSLGVLFEQLKEKIEPEVASILFP